MSRNGIRSLTIMMASLLVIYISVAYLVLTIPW